jgi:hypothetical protein
MEPVPPKPLTASLPTASQPFNGSTIRPINSGSTFMAGGSVDLGHGSVIGYPAPPIPLNSSGTLPVKTIGTLEPVKPLPTAAASLQNISPPPMQQLGQKNSINSDQETNPKMGAQEAGGNGGLLFGNGGSGK